MSTHILITGASRGIGAAIAQELQLNRSRSQAEEQELFPRFEAATGMTQGPTQVMRDEHADMRATLAQLHAALDSRDLDEFAGEAETLLIMMQQHNMKEENILYPMCDLRLGGERDALVETLANRLAPEHAA